MSKNTPDVKGEEIAGKYYEDLSEEFRDRINETSFLIYRNHPEDFRLYRRERLHGLNQSMEKEGRPFLPDLKKSGSPGRYKMRIVKEKGLKIEAVLRRHGYDARYNTALKELIVSNKNRFANIDVSRDVIGVHAFTYLSIKEAEQLLKELAESVSLAKELTKIASVI